MSPSTLTLHRHGFFLLALLAAALLPPGAACGQPVLDAGDLPENAQWYVHANVQGLRQSDLLAPFYEESLGEAFSDIEEEIGLDLSQELTGVTAFGASIPSDSAAVVLHGLTETTQLSMLELITEHGELLELDYAGVSYYQIGKHFGDGHRIDVDDTMLFSFGPEQTLVTSDLDLLQQFIDAGSQLSGTQPPTGDALIVLKASQALVQGGLNPGGMSGAGPFDSSLLENIDQLGGVVSESAAGLSVYAKVFARDDATASYVHNILQGLVSLKALDAGSDPAFNTLISLLSITSDGPEVTLDLTIPPELAADLVDEL
ncbi:MAG: hypothetical protein AAF736_03035 [Pseudomonadota bacterium]